MLSMRAPEEVGANAVDGDIRNHADVLHSISGGPVPPALEMIRNCAPVVCGPGCGSEHTAACLQIDEFKIAFIAGTRSPTVSRDERERCHGRFGRHAGARLPAPRPVHTDP